LLLRKMTVAPISPVANPCCNLILKIGVVLSLGMDDAAALQSKQHETIGAGSPFRLAIASEIARLVVCRLGILVYSLK